MRERAVAYACFQLFLTIPAAFVMLYAAAGNNNAEPEDLAEVAWLNYAAPALVAISIGTIVAAATSRPLWATAGVAAQLAIGIPVLWLGLDNSVHSDGTLMALAAVVWLLGLLAVVESFRDRRRRY